MKTQIHAGSRIQKIIPHLWFDKEAKEAAEFYTSLFPDSKVTNVTTLHDTPSGDSDIVSFELAGQSFMAISAGPLASRAASAIGIIEKMIEYVSANAPLQDHLSAMEVGHTAAFLCSSLASCISGSTVYVDKGYHAVGMAVPPG